MIDLSDFVNLRSRGLFLTTKTDLKAIAAPAIRGFKQPTGWPKNCSVWLRAQFQQEVPIVVRHIGEPLPNSANSYDEVVMVTWAERWCVCRHGSRLFHFDRTTNRLGARRNDATRGTDGVRRQPPNGRSPAFAQIYTERATGIEPA